MGGSPLSHIESTDDIQGGKYCLRGTRIPLAAIVESLEETTMKEQVAALKKYFKFDISEEELSWAVEEYLTRVI